MTGLYTAGSKTAKTIKALWLPSCGRPQAIHAGSRISPHHIETTWLNSIRRPMGVPSAASGRRVGPERGNKLSICTNCLHPSRPLPIKALERASRVRSPKSPLRSGVVTGSFWVRLRKAVLYFHQHSRFVFAIAPLDSWPLPGSIRFFFPRPPRRHDKRSRAHSVIRHSMIDYNRSLHMRHAFVKGITRRRIQLASPAQGVLAAASFRL
jgi:hypothetical protein